MAAAACGSEGGGYVVGSRRGCAPVEYADGVVTQVHDLAQALLDLESLRVVAPVEPQHAPQVREARVGLRDHMLAVDHVRQVHQGVLLLESRLFVEPVAGVPAAALLGQSVIVHGLRYIMTRGAAGLVRRRGGCKDPTARPLQGSDPSAPIQTDSPPVRN